MGGPCQRKDQDSDSAALLPPRAVASVMGTWPDQIQYFGQSLVLPWFTLKQAFVQGNLPASHPMGRVLSLWVELEHLEPTVAELEGEGTAVWEDGRAGWAQGPQFP